MNRKSDHTQLKVGGFLSEVQYYKVIDVRPNNVKVRNERGMEFVIGKEIIEEGSFSADQFEGEEEITRTDLVQILANAGETVFTANFNKKLDVKQFKEAFNDPKNTVKSNAALERMLLGEPRTMIGYLTGADAISGRFQVVDLEAEKAFPKQIDMRTLNWVILRNVKYTVK
jgi:hypothetical protein